MLVAVYRGSVNHLLWFVTDAPLPSLLSPLILAPYKSTRPGTTRPKRCLESHGRLRTMEGGEEPVAAFSLAVYFW
jgi:hypothetical protein